MRSLFKLLGSLIVLLFVFPLITYSASAENQMKQIDIHVQLHEDGSATIQENREMDVSEGTEVYIELSHLGASELVDFEVVGFEEEKDWDLDASFEDKAYRYGVLDLGEDYELVWGMSEYGIQKYELSYSLTNLVRELADGQALFWNFDTFLSTPTEHMRLEVTADDVDLDKAIEEFYGFGFEGPLDIVDGVIQWSGSDLDDGNDVTLLLQFPKGTFNTQTTVDQTLKEQRQLALDGSSYNEEGPMPRSVKILLSVLALIGVGSGGAAVAYGVKRANVREANHHFEPHQVQAKNKNKMDRKPPELEGDFANYSWIISRIYPTSAGFSEYFFAYLLLWADQGKIQIDAQEEQNNFGKTQHKASIHIENFLEEYEINRLAFDDYVALYEIGESRFDEVIWGMLLEVADESGKIKGEAIEKWSKKNAESVDTLIQSLETVSETWLVEHQYLKLFTVDEWGASFEIEQLTTKGEQLAGGIVQYHNFIEKINTAELGTDEDWKNLMIWVVIFDRAEETVEHLEDFHPETWVYLEEMYPYYYGNYYGYHYLYTRNTAGLSSAGYSSSGGGMSSAGGGMGAGGGGGGGTR